MVRSRLRHLVRAFFPQPRRRPVVRQRVRPCRPFVEGLEDRVTPTTYFFANPAAITIPAGAPAVTSGPATPYPSNISVASLPGTVTGVTATLSGFSHTFPDDVGAIVVGPTSAASRLMTDVGASLDVSGINLTFDQSAGSSLPNNGQLVSGTFLPTEGTIAGGGLAAPASFPAPAPAGPYGTTLSTFNSTNPNGAWSLYAIDEASGDSGSFAGGWSLAVTTNTGTAFTYNAATNPGITNYTLRVSGGNYQIVETASPGHVLASQPVAGTTDLDIIGQNGVADTLTVDFTSLTIPSGGLNFDGGTGAGSNLLQVQNGTFNTATFNYTNLHDGSIALDPDGPGGGAASDIAYTNLTPITSTINAANVILNYSQGAETITVTSAGAGMTTVASTLGESTTFANPTASLEINAGATSDDIVNVNSFGSGFAAALDIDGESGAADVITINTALSLGNGANTGHLTLSAETITLSDATVSTDQGTNAGNVTLNGSTVLGANVTVDTDGPGTDGNFNANGTINGTIIATPTLTILAGTGAVTLNTVGIFFFLGGLAVTTSGVTTLNGNISTNKTPGTGDINFSAASGGIVLGSDITINTDPTLGNLGGVVNLSGSTVTGTAAGQLGLTIISGDGNGTDAVILAQVGTAANPLEFLTIRRTTTIGRTLLGGNIFTDNNVGTGNVGTTGQTANVVLGTSVTINTDAGGSGTGGSVNFNTSTINALNLATETLTILAANGEVTLNAVGNLTPLGGLSVSTIFVTTLNGNLTTDEAPGTGDINFSGATGGIVLGADVTINADANLNGAGGVVNLRGSTITATAAGQQSLTIISGDGNVTDAVVLAQVGTAANPLKFLTIQRTSATARTLLNGNVFTDNNAGTGAVMTTGTAANVVLGNNVTINTDAGGAGGGGAVNFNTSTIIALNAANQGLNILAANGAVTLGVVGNTTELGALSVTTSGVTTLNGNITTDEFFGTGDINLSAATGGIVLGNDVTINADFNPNGAGGVVNLSGSTITATAPGQQSLTIISGDGNGTDAVVLAQVGIGANPLEFLTIQRTSATARTLLNGNVFTDNNAGTGAVMTTGSTANVVLGNSITINTDAGATGGGGAVNFNTSTINALTLATETLTIQAANGAVTLGVVGSNTNALGALSVSTSGVTTLNGNLTTDQGGGSGNIDLSAASGGIVLGNDITINSDNSLVGVSGVVNLSGSTITATAAGQQGLTIISGDGNGTDAVVLAQVGTAANPLEFLTIQRTNATPRTLLNGNIFTDNNAGTGAVMTTGITANVVLGNNVTINTDAGGAGGGGPVNFNTSTIIALNAANQTLTILAANGAVTLGVVGSSVNPLGTLAVTTSGVTTLNGNLTTDEAPGTGDINFSGATGGIVLGNDITINSDASLGASSGVVNLSGSAITATAAGQQGLTIISGDGNGTNVVVLAQVGSAANPLEFLTVQRTNSMGRTLLGGNIFTDNNAGTGAVMTTGQTANVVLGNNVTINTDAGGAGGGGAVNFNTSTINAATLSGLGLTITAGNGAVTLNLVGNTGIGLGALSVTTTGLTTLNGNITTDLTPLSGNIDFSGATGGITLGSSITVNSDGNGGGNGGAVNLSGSAVNATAVNQQALTITAGNGSVTLGAVGTTTSLGGLAVTTTGVTTLNGNITTDEDVAGPSFNSGNVNFSGAAGGVVLGNTITINSDATLGGSSGLVNLNTPINAAAAATQGLTIRSGDGDNTNSVILGTVGATTPLGSLTVGATSSMTRTVLNGNITTDVGAGTGNVDFSTATGGIFLVNSITINADGNVNLTGGNVNLSGSTVHATTAGVQGLTIRTGSTAGDVTTAAVGTITALAFLTVNPAVNISLNGSVVTTGAVQLLGFNQVSVNAINAGASTVTISANQDAAGSNDFIQAAGAITTTNATATAVSITVNTAVGGTGQARLRAVNAGTVAGVVTVAANGGPIIDEDGAATTNITAFAANLSGQFIGAVANPLDTSVDSLTTDSAAANGNQNILESNGLTELGLNAGGTGDINLTLVAGAVLSADATTDVTGDVVVVVAPGGVGASGSPVRLSVTSISSTSTNTDQFLSAVGTATIGSPGLSAGTGTVELNAGTFALGNNNLIADTTKLNVNGATFAIATFSETVDTLTLTSGSVTGSSGVLTSTNTIQTRSGSVTAILAGANGLTQSTAGTTALSGINAYTGATAVNGGTLLVNNPGSTAAGSAVTVNNNGTLGGTGTVNGTVTVNSGGTLAPGISPGILRTGNLTLSSGSTFAVEANNPYTTAGTDYDQASVTGTVTLTGAILSLSGGAVAPTTNKVLTIINNDGTADPVTGTFAGRAEGATVMVGTVPMRLSYQGGDGNDVTLSVTPPTITSANATTFTSGTFGSFTVTTMGVPTPALTQTGALPSGVSFVDNGNGTATLSGTPAPSSVGVYPLSIKAANGVGSGFTQAFTLTVQGPPSIAGLQVGPVVAGFANQRSRIDRIVVTFSESLATHPDSAFSLTRVGGAAVPLTVTYNADFSRATLTFSGPQVSGGSLVDGRYRLTVDGNQLITAGGVAIDADGDRAPGGTLNVDFHRLFGDSDGDADTDFTDLARFRLALGGPSTTPLIVYNPVFDSDGDGDVDFTDLAQFRLRLGTVLP